MANEGFFRHIKACRTAILPGSRRRVRYQGDAVGYILPATLERLGLPDADLDVPDQQRFDAYARALCTGREHCWRDEPFDVRNEQGAVVCTLDRGALPLFGIRAWGVHVNGLVPGGYLWVGRRSPGKLLDPGKLDHLVAGGVPAGMSALDTLIKEGHEEASLPEALARQAVWMGEIRYDMERPEGLRRDVLECYDLQLPVDFTPRPADGEVVVFEKWPLDRVLEVVRDSDEFKFNVNLVLIDLLLRHGLLQDEALRAAIDAA